VHLGHRQPVDLQPRADLLDVRVELPPRRPVAVGAVRPHRLDHHGDERVAEPLLAAVRAQPERHRGGHVAAHRLAVDSGQSLGPADSFAS
jgi:hypothetical protein